MAIYRLSIKICSRSKGASAVAKAAYRAAELLKSDYDGREHDYTRKRGVVHKEILLPDHAPAEYADRTVLWNAVEKSETIKNAQLARELELALPVELTKEQNIALAHEFVKQHFVSAGMCADICVHYAKKNNPHAHVMLTIRPLDEHGEWGAKSRKEYILDRNGERIKLPSGEFKTRKICTIDWNEHTKAEEWRSAWGDAVNSALEQQNHAARVDHRSYKRQGVDIIPQVRMGVAAWQMEQRGIRTEKGDKNRAIAVTNQQLGQLRARIKKLRDWAYAQPIQDAPTMIDMMNAINNGQNLNSHWKRISDLKTRAKVLTFLQENNITDMVLAACRNRDQFPPKAVRPRGYDTEKRAAYFNAGRTFGKRRNPKTAQGSLQKIQITYAEKGHRRHEQPKPIHKK
ncbi:MAG: MobA/MobL family protein [Peptococcaceae bacterium]|nr:MobA/MobL family protein [Peptococcaceae bacterium]